MLEIKIQIEDFLETYLFKSNVKFNYTKIKPGPDSGFTSVIKRKLVAYVFYTLPIKLLFMSVRLSHLKYCLFRLNACM
jgi:hypothetical protein